MNCENCNQVITDNASFCGYCGTRVKPEPLPTHTTAEGKEQSLDQNLILTETDLADNGLHTEPAELPEPIINGNQTQQDRHEKIDKKGRSTFLAWLLMILGWGLGGLVPRLFINIVAGLLEQYDWALLSPISGMIFCFIGSVFTFRALLKTKYQIPVKRSFIFIGGWLLTGLLMGYFIFNEPYLFGHDFLHIMFYCVLFFMLGGSLTGFTFSKSNLGIKWYHRAIVALSWSFGGLLGGLIAVLTNFSHTVESSSDGYRYFIAYPFSYNLPGGILVGVIGGGMTLLVLHWARRRRIAIQNKGLMP